MFLKASDCPRLAIILPRYDGEEQLVAIPMSCTMGWTQSPPSFSVMSETVADLTNQRFKDNPRHAQEHRLAPAAKAMDTLCKTGKPADRGTEDQEATALLSQLSPTASMQHSDPNEPPAPRSNRCFQLPVGDTDVFVDDFMQLCQGGPRWLNALRKETSPALRR